MQTLYIFHQADLPFITFPPEIRQQSYSILLNKTFLVYGEPFYHIDHHRKPRLKTQPGLALLRTCKTIHAEASAVLYAKALFRFAIDYCGTDAPEPISKAITDRMMNIDFILNQATFDDCTRNIPEIMNYEVLEPEIKATMGRFTGSGIQRQSCRVLLWAMEYNVEKNFFLSSPMLPAIADMIGFKWLIVELEDQSVSLKDVWARARNEEEGLSDYGQDDSAKERCVSSKTSQY